jgi:Reverse transcriptase (RNA-dependent DNA polymerase)
MLVLQHFYHHSLHVAKLNHAMVCLIPKEKDLRIVQKYIPISLVDCCYKIISKILTNRLAPFMNNLVDNTQTVFIQGRYTQTAHEIIHHTKHAKNKGIVLKVNF